MRREDGTRNFLKTTLIGGIVVLLPLGLFYFVFSFLFYTISGIAKPLLGLSDAYEAFKYPLLVDLFAFVFLVVMCFLVGLLVSTQGGQRWVDRIERKVLFKLPYYGTVREAVHQLLGNSNMNLFKVVLVDLYGTDTLTTAFLTDETKGDYVTVFVPTGPNPTSGFIYHVKRHQVRHVDAKGEDAMRSIIGVGTGSADILNKYFKYENHAAGQPEESVKVERPQQAGTYEESVNN